MTSPFKKIDDNSPAFPPIDSRFTHSSGQAGFTGTELLVKGALEAGVHLITGYPGSPISDVFDCVSRLSPYLDELGVVAQIAHNEALAAARLTGASQLGLRSIAVMKSVGMHVAADALATGNLVEFRKPEGGGLVIVGDDPWNESTQINSDSRYLSLHLNMPVIEPATLQEIKDFVGKGLQLSGASDLFVTYVITANQADGGGTVTLQPNVPLKISPHDPHPFSADQVKTDDVIMIPPFITQRESSLASRYQKLLSECRKIGMNQVIGNEEAAPVGFITSGLSASYLKKVLELAGIWGDVPVLKYGMTFPLDENLLVAFSRRVKKIIVVEEKRGFLESQISSILLRAFQSGQISQIPQLWGKQFEGNKPGFPSVGGLNPSLILSVLENEIISWKSWLPHIQIERIKNLSVQIQDTFRTGPALPVRTPTFCPGCPHRDSAVVALQEIRRSQKSSGSELVFHGESGCHTMLGFQPFGRLMQNYVGMGLGGGAGAGMDAFVSNNHVVFLGDSTFFHSGIIAVSDAIKNNQNTTFVILENKTTAMTGHQPTAASPRDVMGKKSPQQDIEKILKGMLPVGSKILRLDPSQRESYEKIFSKTVRQAGVKVLIADKECAITFHRRRNRVLNESIKSEGFLKREVKIDIDSEVCDYCLDCTQQTACPGLTQIQTPFGPKIATDLTTCTDDGACSRTKACPSFARITLHRRGPSVKSPLPTVSRTSLPAPEVKFVDSWSSHLCGVGGMGIGVLTGVMARAAEMDGYHVHFVNRKGLAIRNGSVFGQLILSRKGPVDSPLDFNGDTDLILGMDLLEACHAVDPANSLRVGHASRTKAVVDHHRHDTVGSLTGKDKFELSELKNYFKNRVNFEQSNFIDFSKISEERLGSRLYANIVILGYSYQKGWVPIREASILSSLGEMVTSEELSVNIEAFMLGRELVLSPGTEVAPDIDEVETVIADRADLLNNEPWVTRSDRQLFPVWIQKCLQELPLGQEDKLYLVYALTDLVRYGGIEHANRYMNEIRSIIEWDSKEKQYRAVSAALKSFHQLMTPKDEIWISRLLVSPEKIKKDLLRHKLDPNQGDQIEYSFLLRPRLNLFGWKQELQLNVSSWPLKIIARMGWLRRLCPGWNKKETEVLCRLSRILSAAGPRASAGDYEILIRILSSVLTIRGYRSIRERNYEISEAAIRDLVSRLSTSIGY